MMKSSESCDRLRSTDSLGESLRIGGGACFASVSAAGPSKEDVQMQQQQQQQQQQQGPARQPSQGHPPPMSAEIASISCPSARRRAYSLEVVGLKTGHEELWRQYAAARRKRRRRLMNEKRSKRRRKEVEDQIRVGRMGYTMPPPPPPPPPPVERTSGKNQPLTSMTDAETDTVEVVKVTKGTETLIASRPPVEPHNLGRKLSSGGQGQATLPGGDQQPPPPPPPPPLTAADAREAPSPGVVQLVEAASTSAPPGREAKRAAVPASDQVQPIPVPGRSTEEAFAGPVAETPCLFRTTADSKLAVAEIDQAVPATPIGVALPQQTAEEVPAMEAPDQIPIDTAFPEAELAGVDSAHATAAPVASAGIAPALGQAVSRPDASRSPPRPANIRPLPDARDADGLVANAGDAEQRTGYSPDSSTSTAQRVPLVDDALLSPPSAQELPTTIDGGDVSIPPKGHPLVSTPEVWPTNVHQSERALAGAPPLQPPQPIPDVVVVEAPTAPHKNVRSEPSTPRESTSPPNLEGAPSFEQLVRKVDQQARAPADMHKAPVTTASHQTHGTLPGVRRLMANAGQSRIQPTIAPAETRPLRPPPPPPPPPPPSLVKKARAIDLLGVPPPMTARYAFAGAPGVEHLMANAAQTRAAAFPVNVPPPPPPPPIPPPMRPGSHSRPSAGTLLPPLQAAPVTDERLPPLRTVPAAFASALHAGQTQQQRPSQSSQPPLQQQSWFMPPSNPRASEGAANCLNLAYATGPQQGLVPVGANMACMLGTPFLGGPRFAGPSMLDVLQRMGGVAQAQIGAVALGQGLYNGPNLNVSNVPQAAAMGPTNAANLTAMGLAPIRDQSSAGATMDYRPPNFDASHQAFHRRPIHTSPTQAMLNGRQQISYQPTLPMKTTLPQPMMSERPRPTTPLSRVQPVATDPSRRRGPSAAEPLQSIPAMLSQHAIQGDRSIPSIPALRPSQTASEDSPLMSGGREPTLVSRPRIQAERSHERRSEISQTSCSSHPQVMPCAMPPRPMQVEVPHGEGAASCRAAYSYGNGRTGGAGRCSPASSNRDTNAHSYDTSRSQHEAHLHHQQQQQRPQQQTQHEKRDQREEHRPHQRQHHQHQEHSYLQEYGGSVDTTDCHRIGSKKRKRPARRHRFEHASRQAPLEGLVDGSHFDEVYTQEASPEAGPDERSLWYRYTCCSRRCNECWSLEQMQRARDRVPQLLPHTPRRQTQDQKQDREHYCDRPEENDARNDAVDRTYEAHEDFLKTCFRKGEELFSVDDGRETIRVCRSFFSALSGFSMEMIAWAVQDGVEDDDASKKKRDSGVRLCEFFIHELASHWQPKDDGVNIEIPFRTKLVVYKLFVESSMMKEWCALRNREPPIYSSFVTTWSNHCGNITVKQSGRRSRKTSSLEDQSQEQQQEPEQLEQQEGSQQQQQQQGLQHVQEEQRRKGQQQQQQQQQQEKPQQCEESGHSLKEEEGRLQQQPQTQSQPQHEKLLQERQQQMKPLQEKQGAIEVDMGITPEELKQPTAADAVQNRSSEPTVLGKMTLSGVGCEKGELGSTSTCER